MKYERCGVPLALSWLLAGTLTIGVRAEDEHHHASGGSGGGFSHSESTFSHEPAHAGPSSFEHHEPSAFHEMSHPMSAPGEFGAHAPEHFEHHAIEPFERMGHTPEPFGAFPSPAAQPFGQRAGGMQTQNWPPPAPRPQAVSPSMMGHSTVMGNSTNSTGSRQNQTSGFSQNGVTPHAMYANQNAMHASTNATRPAVQGQSFKIDGNDIEHPGVIRQQQAIDKQVQQFAKEDGGHLTEDEKKLVNREENHLQREISRDIRRDFERRLEAFDRHHEDWRQYHDHDWQWRYRHDFNSAVGAGVQLNSSVVANGVNGGLFSGSPTPAPGTSESAQSDMFPFSGSNPVQPWGSDYGQYPEFVADDYPPSSGDFMEQPDNWLPNPDLADNPCGSTPLLDQAMPSGFTPVWGRNADAGSNYGRWQPEQQSNDLGANLQQPAAGINNTTATMLPTTTSRPATGATNQIPALLQSNRNGGPYWGRDARWLEHQVRLDGLISWSDLHKLNWRHDRDRTETAPQRTPATAQSDPLAASINRDLRDGADEQNASEGSRSYGEGRNGSDRH
jgi:hypothetical protein